MTGPTKASNAKATREKEECFARKERQILFQSPRCSRLH